MGQSNSVLVNQVVALVLNVKAWFVSNYIPRFLRAKAAPLPSPGVERCVIVAGPGGLDQLQVVELKDRVTRGYNLGNTPFTALADEYDPSLVVVKVDYFSINFADVCIRWGLYESALRYVGWPICPGFDLSGTVAWADPSSGLRQGDKVFGFSLFGAYSSRVLVPARQLRRTPSALRQNVAAAVPAVAATALHAVALAGGWPQQVRTTNKAVLIHSAAGGVGSMLIQICKLRGYSPIVAVVGSAHKVNFCRNLGADFVIDKSSCSNFWKRAREVCPNLFTAIFDANGVESIEHSYQHLSQCGTIVCYGFHSNVPKAKTFLSPREWVSMIIKMARMPRFDAMDLVLSSKRIAGFNLSFFSEEHDLIAQYMDEILSWLQSGSLTCPDPTVFPVSQIADAHELIQSGQSVGKIVVSH